MATRIAILDYGMGNLRSVEKAIERGGRESPRSRPIPSVPARPTASSCPASVPFRRRCDGCASSAIDELIAERAAQGRPVLGICLGMQLLFESSTENEGETGIGVLEGSVAPLAANGLKVPHIGWSPVRWAHPRR